MSELEQFMRLFVPVAVLMATYWAVVSITYSSRKRKYPEHTVEAVWDDEKAEYYYEYKHYGVSITSGKKAWADKQAAHYNISITNPNKRKEDV